MAIRLALLAALFFGLFVAYLTSLNTGDVRVSIARHWTYDLPLIALVVGAFLVGASLALTVSAVRGLVHSFRDARRARCAGPEASVSETYRRGMEAQRAGDTAAAVGAYGAVREREAAHVGAAPRLAEIARAAGDLTGALGYDDQALSSEERAETLLAVAEDCRRLGRPDDAIATYRRLLDRDRDHAAALRGLREVAVERGRWAEALEAQERLVRLATRDKGSGEEAWLAGLLYECGQECLAAGDTTAAIRRFKEALRAVPDFEPAALRLGDAWLQAGDAREAMRAWDRALAAGPSAVLLARIGELHRAEGRPARMIALYEGAAARHPDNLAVALGLGRAYLELAMLGEAAEQFEKMEVRAPEQPVIHAFLGAVFERRGQAREAFEEYRRALGWSETMQWPHRCSACGASHSGWVDRCLSCRRWNTSRP